MEVTSEHSSVYGRKQQAERRSAGTGGQAAEHTRGSSAPDFLRHLFLPLCSMDTEQLPDKGVVEIPYLQSLERLRGFYGIVLPDLKGKPYPYNVLYSHWAVQRQLKQRNADIKLQIVSREGQTLLATEDRLDTNHKVYYIPVKPLYKLSKSDAIQDRKSFAILMSVCSYLYHNAQVAYYRTEDTYLYWQYEGIAEWLLETKNDWVVPAYLDNRNAIRDAKRYGDLMERKIYQAANIQYFQQRLGCFRPQTAWQMECFSIGKRCYQIMEQYPDYNLYSHIQPLHRDMDENLDDDYEGGYIYPEQYVSFVASLDDWLGDTIIESVSNELNEYWHIQEPAVNVVFDGKETISDSISYERELFDLIGDLYHLLKQI